MPPTLDQTFGAEFIGLLFATFFQGLLTLQTYTYFVNFRKDPWLLKALVATVWSMDAVHLGLIASVVYHYLVTSWGKPEGLALTTIPGNLHVLFIALPSLLCQGFFLYRIWIFSRGNWMIVGFLAVLCLASFGGALDITAEILGDKFTAEYSGQRKQFLWTICLSGAADLSIALTLVWYIRKTKGASDNLGWVHERTDRILDQIMMYAVATGIAPSLLGFTSLAMYLASPTTLIFIAIYFSFGRMYTNALMLNLNARNSLRNRLYDQSALPVSINPATSLTVQVHRSRTETTSELELQTVGKSALD